MKKEQLKDLINEELESTKLIYHMHGVERFKEYLIEDLEAFGSSKVKTIKLTVINVKLYLHADGIGASFDIILTINNFYNITYKDKVILRKKII